MGHLARMQTLPLPLPLLTIKMIIQANVVKVCIPVSLNNALECHSLDVTQVRLISLNNTWPRLACLQLALNGGNGNMI